MISCSSERSLWTPSVQPVSPPSWLRSCLFAVGGGGITARVIEVVLNKEWAGQTPEELQGDMPHLTLAQIYAALYYYHEHKEELDAEIARQYELAEKMRTEAGESPFARRMRAAGKLC